MKDIKCKAWDKTHKEWINYGFCLRFDANGNCEVLNAFAQPFPDRKVIPVFWVGLTDKHGKDIYQGDIVKSYRPWDDWGDTLQVVKYEHGTWNYSYDLYEYAAKPEEDWEVVGNVYESPELLEGLEKP